MKLFFMHVIPSNNSIYSKVRNQIDTFSKYVEEGELEAFDFIREVNSDNKSVVYSVGDINIRFFNNKGKIGTLYTLVVTYPMLYDAVLKYLSQNGFTHIYIRRTICDRQFIHFLKKLKMHGIKIIYEIPTWPYDKEFPENSSMLKIEQKWRIELSNYVDRIVTPSYGYSEILNVPVIYTPNGIITKNIKAVRTNRAIEINTINLIAVAGLSAWHGYERLIWGLINYKNSGGKVRVMLHIVGGEKDNEYRVLYESLVKKYELEDQVLFYGNQFGDSLDLIYDKADIAVSSLGLHRLGLTVSTTLKSREYLAKGLPIITEGVIDIIPKDYPYVLSFPMDESAIEVNEIIDFYNRIYLQDGVTRETIVETIRHYAQETCDMYNLNKVIIDYINEKH